MAGKAGKGACDDGKQNQYTTIKVRLYPTEAQAVLLEKTFGCCRYLWNQMLADVQEFYAATDVHYIPTPARYKRGAPFLTEVDSQALCAVHQSLRQAFVNFFRAPAAFGYPQLKTKKAGRDSFTVYCRQYRTGPSIYLTDKGVQMPKLGLLKARLHRKPLRGWDLRLVSVSKSKAGHYFCSLSFGYAVKKPREVAPTRERTLGLNHSLTRFYVDSGGNSPVLPYRPEQSREKLARMQQKLSRMERGSKNYEAQLQKIRLLHEHMANQRRDFIHKESRRIANAWDAVCVRESDLTQVSQRIRGVSRVDSGFGLFRACLDYKLARQGKRLIVIDGYAPTAKTCHECGHVNEKLTTRDRRWRCPQCGAELAREVNAAQNIRDFGLAQLHREAGVA